MRTAKIKITAIQFENGHVLIGADIGESRYYVNTDGTILTGTIMCYTRKEIQEIYDVDIFDVI